MWKEKIKFGKIKSNGYNDFLLGEPIFVCSFQKKVF